MGGEFRSAVQFHSSKNNLVLDIVCYSLENGTRIRLRYPLNWWCFCITVTHSFITETVWTNKFCRLSPTVVSFLTIIRIVSFKSRVSILIKIQGSNVDNGDKMPFLVTMEKCWQRTAKQCDVDADKIKKEIED